MIKKVGIFYRYVDSNQIKRKRLVYEIKTDRVFYHEINSEGNIESSDWFHSTNWYLFEPHEDNTNISMLLYAE